ncbi:DddA-like double-stranded DNA deaminase toxin [Actinokineospora sp. NPDC004072]
MSIEAVAAAIRGALDKVSTGSASLTAATRHFEEARALIARATSGTGRPEAAAALDALTRALRQLGEVHGNATACANGFIEYLSNVAGAAGRRAPSAASMRSAHGSKVEQARRELPPPIEGTMTGRKTHGRWFVGNGPVQTLISGRDHTAILAETYLDQLGAERAAINTHVEIKLSAMIRQRWEDTGATANVTLVINNNVCDGDLSCASFLPRLLPPGCSITVITPTGRQVFTGARA